MGHGVEEFSLRILSAGRFVGLVPTRSVAESVVSVSFSKQFGKPMIPIPLRNICTGPKLLQPRSRQ